MNYKTYLFDFDYTLADSSRGIVTCFRKMCIRDRLSGSRQSGTANLYRYGQGNRNSFHQLLLQERSLPGFTEEYNQLLRHSIHAVSYTHLTGDSLRNPKDRSDRMASETISACTYPWQTGHFTTHQSEKNFRKDE